MLRHEYRQKVLSKLTNARNDLEAALSLSTPAARYDPVLLSEATRTQLASMIEDLNGVLRQLEGVQ